MINCIANGNPIPDIKWTDNNFNLINSVPQVSSFV